MANILGTGGAGCSGSHTRYFLEKSGHTVVVLDNLERGHADAVAEGMLWQVDVRDTARVKEVLRKEKVEAVFHFAAYARVWPFSLIRARIHFDEDL
jgi:UDP-glucose 4-epimerase